MKKKVELFYIEIWLFALKNNNKPNKKPWTISILYSVYICVYNLLSLVLVMQRRLIARKLCMKKSHIFN